MSLHLITGYAGQEHITSADQGAYNAATFGEGEFVLDRGAKFNATVLSNNSISIADGEAMMQGRFIKMPSGTSETVGIDNGTVGKKRNDLIVIRYSKDSSTSIETTSLMVIKGTETDGTAVDPEYTHGDITDGTDIVNEMPLYRVSLDGINISKITALFSVKVSMVEYMDSYQIIPARSNKLGGVKIGQNVKVTSDGTISVDKYTFNNEFDVSYQNEVSLKHSSNRLAFKVIYAATIPAKSLSEVVVRAEDNSEMYYTVAKDIYWVSKRLIINGSSTTYKYAIVDVDYDAYAKGIDLTKAYTLFIYNFSDASITFPKDSIIQGQVMFDTRFVKGV